MARTSVECDSLAEGTGEGTNPRGRPLHLVRVTTSRSASGAEVNADRAHGGHTPSHDLRSDVDRWAPEEAPAQRGFGARSENAADEGYLDRQHEERGLDLSAGERLSVLDCRIREAADRLPARRGRTCRRSNGGQPRNPDAIAYVRSRDDRYLDRIGTEAHWTPGVTDDAGMPALEPDPKPRTEPHRSLATPDPPGRYT